MSARVIYLPADHFDPPEHTCLVDDCNGTECLEVWADARLDAMTEQADQDRKERDH